MKRLTRSRHRQKGLTAVGWLLVATIFGFLLLTFFRVFPMYYDNMKVQSALEGLAEDSEIDFNSKRAVWNALAKRLRIQGVKNLNQNHLIVTKTKSGEINLRIRYEVRAPYIANLFIGASFDESIAITR